jgi:para-aminobenzoate synthetase component 2
MSPSGQRNNDEAELEASGKAGEWHHVGVSTRILVVDNYDSFVFNLVQYLGQLGAEVVVRRNDAVTTREVLDGEVDGRPVDGVLLSPGPGTPKDAGVCEDLVREVGGRLPLFGVCLGHQAIAEVYGAVVSRAPELLHGKTSIVRHSGAGLLRGLPSPFTATRYHSLAVEEATLPSEIEVTGRTDSGVVMSLRHRELPIEGVQFHPESVLTQAGHLLLANWLADCGDDQALELAPPLVERTEQRRLSAYL